MVELLALGIVINFIHFVVSNFGSLIKRLLMFLNICGLILGNGGIHMYMDMVNKSNMAILVLGSF